MTKNKYKKLKNNTLPFLCPLCQQKFPFQNLTSKELKNILSSSRSSLSTQNTSINKLSPKSKELLKFFCQIRQVVDSTELTLAVTIMILMISAKLK